MTIFAMYFYGWEIGQLTALHSNEFQFEYSSEWPLQLSAELPIGKIHESRRMPAFFENLLPEGWMESQLLASFDIASGDKVALLACTQKYLSNLTMRTSDSDLSDLVFDTLDSPLSIISPSTDAVIKARCDIVNDSLLQYLLRALGKKGLVGIAGVQAKLPVSLAVDSDAELILTPGFQRNSCSHILKYQSPVFPNLVENEWATMELARRLGLPAAPVRQVEFSTESIVPGRALLIERFDVPSIQAFTQHDTSLRLALQQDAASLLRLHSKDKYDTSAEEIAKALLEAGVSVDGMRMFLRHLLFSWMIGNGDLHAKNVSIITWLTPVELGAMPSLHSVEYAPLYDVLNTRVPIPGDRFAFRVNGENDKLKVKDFAALASRFQISSQEVSILAADLAGRILKELPDVLRQSGLPQELQDSYLAVVNENLSSIE